LKPPEKKLCDPSTHQPPPQNTAGLRRLASRGYGYLYLPSDLTLTKHT